MPQKTQLTVGNTADVGETVALSEALPCDFVLTSDGELHQVVNQIPDPIIEPPVDPPIAQPLAAVEVEEGKTLVITLSTGQLSQVDSTTEVHVIETLNVVVGDVECLEPSLSNDNGLIVFTPQTPPLHITGALNLWNVEMAHVSVDGAGQKWVYVTVFDDSFASAEPDTEEIVGAAMAANPNFIGAYIVNRGEALQRTTAGGEDEAQEEAAE